MTKYVLFFPGSEEEYAAPSFDVAQLMKISGEKSVVAWLNDAHKKGEFEYLSIKDILPRIRKFQGTSSDFHAALKFFKAEDWGINVNSLKFSGLCFGEGEGND